MPRCQLRKSAAGRLLVARSAASRRNAHHQTRFPAHEPGAVARFCVSDNGPSGGGVPDLVLYPSLASVRVGGHAQLFARDPSGGNDVTTRAQWTSSDESVATVEHGWITGVGHGRAEVQAAYGGEVPSPNVAIFVDLARLVVTPAAATAVAQSYTWDTQLRATAVFTDGTKADATEDATWTSSDPDVAAVYGGTIDGLQPGVVHVMAAIGDVMGTAMVTVGP